MKRIAMILVMIALFAVSAAALQVQNVGFGSSSQDRNANLTATVTITNNNGGTLTNIQVTPNAESKYALSASNVPTNITGSTGTFTLTAKVPLDFDAVDSTNFKEQAFSIGSFTVSASNGGTQETAVGNVSMQAVNQLEIDKVRVECDTKSKSVDDGDTVDNLKPGEICNLEIELKNNFDDDDRNDLRIGDVEFTSVSISVDSSDNDVDISDEDDIDEIGPDDEDLATYEIDIDDETDDGKVTINIKVSATDENNALHGESLEFKLGIERLSHDVQLRSIEITPDRITTCGESRIQAVAHLLNQGRRDEDEAAVSVSVDEFKFSEKRENIELDRDDRASISFDIPVPEGIKPGVVKVNFKTFFDNLAESNIGSVDLTIEECKVEEEPEEDDEPEVVVVPNPQPVQTQPPSTTTTPNPSQSTAAPRKTSFTNSTAYVALLLVGIFFVVVVIIVLLVVLLRRK